MITLSEFTKRILYGEKVEDKLFEVDKVEFDCFEGEIPTLPARSKKIAFSTKQIKFPKGNFSDVEKKAIALHSFANHELLAVEMMATALGYFPHSTPEQKRMKQGILSSLKDEQRHFKLYVNRLNEIGYEFGDFPLNEFFWKIMGKLTSPEKYFSVMSLTFEAANLDFAYFYEQVFREIEDHKTADILNEVYKDEISHVALGVNYLNRWREDKSLWAYYLENLPMPITPARAKGKVFIEEARYLSKLDAGFVEKLKKYSDDFKVTNRKEWKK